MTAFLLGALAIAGMFLALLTVLALVLAFSEALMWIGMVGALVALAVVIGSAIQHNDPPEWITITGMASLGVVMFAALGAE